jgi:hypothetical protein
MTNNKIKQSNNRKLPLDYSLLLYNVNRNIYLLNYLFPTHHEFQRFAYYIVKLPLLHIIINATLTATKKQKTGLKIAFSNPVFAHF